MNLGKAIKEIRAGKGLNQKQAAEVIGCKQQQLSIWESKKSLPSDTIKKIAAGYGVPPVIVIYMATEVADTKANKKEFFKTLKPALDDIVAKIISGK